MKEKERNKLIKKISEIQLPGSIMNFVEKYEKIWRSRDIFLWKWSYSFLTSRNPKITFSCVPEKDFYKINELKTLIIMFISLLDDAADKYKNKKLLEELSKIPFEKTKSKRLSEKVKFGYELWEYIYKNVSKLPRFREFKDIFMFDVRAMMNCFYYSFLINKHINVINFTESKIHGGYNMGTFLYVDLDLMASPEFDENELPWIREITWHAQQMARIGNWISTWEREINEKDFTSGMFSYSLMNKILSLEDIRLLETKNIEKRNHVISKIAPKIEKIFLGEWKRNYQKIKALSKNVKTVDIDEFLKGLERVLKYHLASRGLK